MKVPILILSVVASLVVSFAMTRYSVQDKAPLLTLSGTVEDLEVREEDTPSKYGMSFVFVRLKMKITNADIQPVILLRSDPLCNEIVVAKEAGGLDVRSGNFLAYSSASSSEITSPEWLRLHSSLDQAVPPATETQILYSNDSIDFDAMIRLDLPKHPEMYASSPTRSTSLHRLEELSPLVLRVRCTLWPRNLEGIGDERNQLKFGHELQDRWKNFGFLWLNDLKSQPITLDLKATRKP
jgi:hypothetical protein